MSMQRKQPISGRLNRFSQFMWVTVLVCASCHLTGCQQLRYWRHNQFKVGPNYEEPAAHIQSTWLDAEHGQLVGDLSIDEQWWSVFQDSKLDELIAFASDQNPNLKTLAARVSESRALLDIACANLFPQSQSTTTQYSHTQNSLNNGTAFPGFPLTLDDWKTSFDASWEVDLWGRIRRSIDAANASLESSMADYDHLVVTLRGEVATAYIQLRSFDERIELARENVKLQQGSYNLAEIRLREGKITALDVEQAKANMAQTKSLIPQLEQGRRQTLNALALLLGTTPAEVKQIIQGPGKLPSVPDTLFVGIPADLLRRRPDIRSAERALAASAEQIGIAEADLYPQFGVNGTIGYQAADLGDLLTGASYTGTIAPAFRWKILNYGRLQNNILVQEARFQQQLGVFENTVLTAQREVEDGMIEFLKSKEALKHIQESARANEKSVELVNTLYREGAVDFGRVFVLESGLVTIQDAVVQGKAAVALALVKTYKALGGGWDVGENCEVRLATQTVSAAPSSRSADGNSEMSNRTLKSKSVNRQPAGQFEGQIKGSAESVEDATPEPLPLEELEDATNSVLDDPAQ